MSQHFKDFIDIKQNYDKYTDKDRHVWQLLYNRQMEVLPGRAEAEFLNALPRVGFSADKIPQFTETNKKLSAITGWNLVVVPGLIGNKPFFELLKNNYFPASTWLRKEDQLDYLQEPDMFHDVFGHVPLLSNPDFCGYLSGLSEVALPYIDNEWIVEIVSRLYWYTVEFGLIKTDEGMRIYGAGILSSPGESVYSLESDVPQRVPFNVREILATPYIKDKFQEKYFVIESYEQLYNSVGEIAEAIAEEAKQKQTA
jgi:phenylalanine-4-hydroxylase